MNKILKFGASWCQPCRQLSGVIQKLPQEQHDAITEYDIDTCDPSIVSKYNVRGVPTLIVLNEKDEVLKRLSGSQSLSTIQGLFNI